MFKQKTEKAQKSSYNKNLEDMDEVMKLVLSDIDGGMLHINGAHEVVENNSKICHCIGCFNCWIKTPGKCAISDSYQEMGKKFSQCDELVIVSECVYGSTSPFIKNVMDRAISYIHPNFCIRNGEMHHKRRYDNKIVISAYFYGDKITQEEKETAQRLMEANAVNYDGKVKKVVFLNSKEALGDVEI